MSPANQKDFKGRLLKKFGYAPSKQYGGERTA